MGRRARRLAEGYEADGQKALAIAAYERALALDPSLASSAERLKLLRQEAAGPGAAAR